MRKRLGVLLIACVTAAGAQPLRFTRRDIRHLGAESIRGFVISGSRLATWGDHLRWWSIPDGRMAAFGPRGPFAEGGGILDVDRDGLLDIVVNERPPNHALVWFRAPRWTRHVIDTGVDTADVMPVELFGRRGILLVHRRAQVRFYEVPNDPAERWPATEIYSFYTPSDQGGLAIADIDGDGRPDILCGNYWIRSPESFELPWRLFAIELWNEQPHSAMLRLAYFDLWHAAARNLIALQREMPGARFSWFEQPADPKQLWTEHPITVSPPLDHPRGFDVADFDGHGRCDLLVSERGGAGRLFVFRNQGDGHLKAQLIATGVAAEHAQAIDWNHDGRMDILTIGKGVISVWKNEGR